MAAAPEIFKVDDEDLLHLLTETIPDDLQTKAENAVRMCPRQAIKIVEE